MRLVLALIKTGIDGQLLSFSIMEFDRPDDGDTSNPSPQGRTAHPAHH
jgi:hypothetical protein